MAAQKLLQDGLEKQATTSSSLSFKNEDYIIENFSETAEIFSLLLDINPYYKKGSLEVKQINDYVKSEVMDELDTLNFISGNDNVSSFLKTYREKQSGYKTSEKVQGCLSFH